MAKEGWRVRVAVRRPNDALFVKPYGVVGQVEPVACNIRDDASVRAVMKGADAVVNCVGILNGHGKNTFGAVQADGAPASPASRRRRRGKPRPPLGHRRGRKQRLGIPADESRRRKGRAGRLPLGVILRPSIIFGNEDGFFNRFASMARLGPVLPVVGADTRFQPVYVDDVAQAAVKGIKGEAAPGIYELGGPDVDTFRDLMRQMLAVIHRRRLIVNVPFFVASIMGGAFDLLQAVTLGLFRNGLITATRSAT